MEHTKNPLRAVYEQVCNTYADRLLKQLGYKKNENTYWIADHVGEVLDIHGYYFLDMPDIALLVDNEIGYEEFDDWYTQWVDLDNKQRINLRSWIMGARNEQS